MCRFGQDGLPVYADTPIVGVIAAAKFGLKTIMWLNFAFWVLIMLMFLNDGIAEYRDVSHEPDHAVWVGQRCTVLKDLVALGVTHHPGPNKITDVVVISTQGTSGPEITFRRPIHKGVDMLITGVERCTNCRLFAYGRIQYVVTIIPNLRELAPYRVAAEPDVLDPDQVHCAKDVSPAQ